MDSDEEVVQDASMELPKVQLIRADATEAAVIEELGLEQFDGAAVVIGENIQASILVTMILKEIGAPYVFARAAGPLHARVLERVGADRVIQPEKEFGELIARSMASPGILDYLELGGDEALAEMKPPSGWIGRSLMDFQLPRKRGITVLALKSEDGDWSIPRPGKPIEKTDILIVGGLRGRVEHLGAE